MDAPSYQTFFTSYLLLLIIFGVIALSCFALLVVTIPKILYPFFYGDFGVLLATGLIQITCGVFLIAIDHKRCCCGKGLVRKHLKNVIFPVFLTLFAAMWLALLLIPHNHYLHLKNTLVEEVQRNETDGLMQLAYKELHCCGIENEISCSQNFLPIVLPDGNGFDGFICRKGSTDCFQGCASSVMKKMIMPYRPIEMVLGLLGLLLLAVCPLIYAISRCRFYMCPMAIPPESTTVTTAPSIDDTTFTDDTVPLYPVEDNQQLRPVLESLLKTHKPALDSDEAV